MPRRWRIAGINFDHFHMGDLLRMALEHPDVDLVGLSDGDVQRTRDAAREFGVPRENVFQDFRDCLKQTRPDIVILCPATAEHADWTEKVAPFGVHLLIEKPFAATLAEADRMIRAMEEADRTLAVNWPLRWYPCHATAQRLVHEGQVGDVLEVHYYDGNRGPLWHGAAKVAREPTPEEKHQSWFYRKSAGGGSLLDYLGYGTTLASWFHGGRKPLEITCMVDSPEGLEVDEQSVTIARYDVGLSTFQTRWGTFSDPWIQQPQPKCGFVIRGSEGTLSSYDFEDHVLLQTSEAPHGEAVPVDVLQPPYQNPVQYLVHCLGADLPVAGPLSVDLSRTGQQIVDTALRSAEQKKTLALIE